MSKSPPGGSRQLQEVWHTPLGRVVDSNSKPGENKVFNHLAPLPRPKAGHLGREIILGVVGVSHLAERTPAGELTAAVSVQGTVKWARIKTDSRN